MNFRAPAALVFLLALAPPLAHAKDELKFGTLAPDNTPWSKILVNFRRQFEAETKGQYTVKIYLNGKLGDERAMLEKIKFGRLTGGGFSTSGIATVAPEIQVFEVPFLFRNNQESDYIMDEVVLQDMRELLAKKGLYLYIWAENGWLDWGSRKSAVNSIKDLNALKVWSQESDVQLTIYSSLGVQTVPLGVPEVVTSLQTGIIDAVASTPVFALGAQWFRHLQFWLDTNHSYQPAAVVFALKWWDSLPPEARGALDKMAKELQASARKDVRGIDSGIFKGFEKAGVKITPITPGARQEFEQKAAAVGPALVKKGVVPQALWDKIQAALKKHRGG